jgi:hypothetical protein
MTGRRNDVEPHLMEPGDYGRWPGRERLGWWCKTPNGHGGNLRAHTITEHDDRTITVAPSILVGDATGELWHGYLERGVWRSV